MTLSLKSEKKRVPLIVDGDKQFLSALSDSQPSETNSPLLLSSGKQAQVLIAEGTHKLSGIYINSSLKGYTCSVIRFAHRYCPATPIYLLVDQSNESIPEQDWFK